MRWRRNFALIVIGHFLLNIIFRCFIIKGEMGGYFIMVDKGRGSRERWYPKGS